MNVLAENATINTNTANITSSTTTKSSTSSTSGGTTNTATSNLSNSSGNSSGLSQGAKIGIGVGVSLGVLLIIAIIILTVICYRLLRAQKPPVVGGVLSHDSRRGHAKPGLMNTEKSVQELSGENRGKDLSELMAARKSNDTMRRHELPIPQSPVDA